MNNTENVYIAGASSRARTAKEYLEKLNPDLKVRAFLVSPEMDDNPDAADGIPVRSISVESGHDTSAVVYIGTRGVNQDKISRELQAVGFSKDKIIPVTPEVDMKLRNEYVRLAFEKEGRSFEKMDMIEGVKPDASYDDAALYIAKTVFDAPFEEPVELKEYERIIQVGTDLSDSLLSEADHHDNEGDNISAKNVHFCEMTGMYWIWKNSSEKTVGLEHWRRRFILPANWRSVMTEKKANVILPVPLCVMPSLEENFVTRHLPVIWNATMDIMGELHPEDASKAKVFFENTNLYSPCNMLIAEKKVFDDYCEWLFPILFELNIRIGQVEDKYQNRYPGFVSERLLNYYFRIKNQDLKVMYADKSFLK